MIKMDSVGNCTRIFTSDAFPDKLFLIHTTFMVLMFFGIITSNLSMIFGLLKVNNRLTLSKKLFICLSCSDLITCLCTLPVQTIASFEKDDAKCSLISVQAFFNAFPTSLSLFFLLHISFSRYCAVKYPNSQVFTLQKRFWKHFVVCEILISFVNGLWYALGASQTNDHIQHASFILFCSFFVVVILSMILILNGRLWTSLTTHRKLTVTNHINEERIVKLHRTAVKTIIILSVILVICYMPTVISFSITAGFLFARDQRAEYYHYLIPWSYILLLMNSGINSFVIIVRDRKLQAFLKNLCWKLEYRTKEPFPHDSESRYSGNHLILSHLPSFISSSIRMKRRSHRLASNCNSPFNLSPDRCLSRLSCNSNSPNNNQRKSLVRLSQASNSPNISSRESAI